MSAQEEIRTALDQIIAAAAKGDFTPFVAALDDDLEVFDHGLRKSLHFQPQTVAQ